MKALGLLAAAAVFVSGCQSARYEGNENSPYYLVPAGSRVILSRELTIPAHQLSVYIQDGQVTTFSRINAYQPHCKFELHALSDSPRTVQKDEFIVVRSVQEIQHTVKAGLLYARAPLARRTAGGTDDGGPSVQAWATRLDLRSERQPQVSRLSCGHWDYPPAAQHLSIAEMRRALGEVFALRIAARSR